MRLNIRKLIFVGGVFVVLWLLVSYLSMFVPVNKSNNSVSNLKLELDRLENKMKDQLSDSYQLLERVKSRLKAVEEKSVDEKVKAALNSENEVDLTQSKYS